MSKIKKVVRVRNSYETSNNYIEYEGVESIAPILQQIEGYSVEVPMIILLRNGKVIGYEMMDHGEKTSAIFSLSWIEGTIKYIGADSIILVHNHPDVGGKPSLTTPSKADIESGLQLINFCERIGIKLVDLIIVNSDSMFQSYLKDSFELKKNLYGDDIEEYEEPGDYRLGAYIVLSLLIIIIAMIILS